MSSRRHYRERLIKDHIVLNINKSLLQEACREREEEERKKHRQEKMQASRRAAIQTLHQRREEKKRWRERLAQEEIVSDLLESVSPLLPPSLPQRFSFRQVVKLRDVRNR